MEYLLKASAVVVIFYVCYKLFLQRETFFSSNRWYLLSGILIAIFIPFVVIPIYITKEVPLVLTESFYPITQSSSFIQEESLNLMTLLPYLYGIGVIFFAVRLAFQFSSLSKLVFINKKEKRHSFSFIITNENVTPFSFFKWIVYNPSQFNSKELDQIITHEKVHASQFHSIDILLIQMASVIFWFNPFIWLYKKALQQNLEFIADSVTENNIECKKSYQHLLLRTSIQNHQLVLANNFYNSLIKKRIVMLHKNRSQKQNQWKLLLVIPLIAFFLMSFNTKEIITYKGAPIIDKVSTKSIVGNVEMIMITKSTSDDELKEITSNYEKKGIEIKFKGIKRNDAGEITRIDISAKTENGKVTYNTNDDKSIDPIKITIDIENDKISVGDSGNDLHFSDENSFSYTMGYDKNKIHKSKSGDNVFVYSNSEHEHEDLEEHENEIIENDDKIIIKKGNVVHELKKEHINKNKNVFVITNGKGETFDIINADTIHADGKVFKLKGNVAITHDGKSKGKYVISDGDGELIELKGEGHEDGDMIFIRKDEDGNIVKEKIKSEGNSFIFESKDGKIFKTEEKRNNIWINDEDNNEKVIIKSSKNGGTMFFSGDSIEESLIVIDGKEVKGKKLEDIDVDTIKSINVLKGESAEKKYGEKGKNGVIEITTKKKKD